MKNLKKWPLGALLAALFIGAALLTNNMQSNANGRVAAGYTCPVTGDTLPCPSCCPFK